MKLSDQVILLEQAKRLKELGVTQAAFFRHQHYPETIYRIEAQTIDSGDFTATDPGEWFSAFTVGELGVMLPKGGVGYSYYHRNNWRGHSVGYSAPADSKNHIERPWFQNEAEARADLLIHLLETKSITPEEVNNRLKQ